MNVIGAAVTANDWGRAHVATGLAPKCALSECAYHSATQVVPRVVEYPRVGRRFGFYRGCCERRRPEQSLLSSAVHPTCCVVRLRPTASSGDPNTEHGDRAAIESRDRKGCRLAILLLSENVQQRQVMLRRRDCEHRVRSERLVVNERSVVAGENQLTRQLFEPNSPSRRVRPGGGPRNRCEGYAQGCRCRRSGRLHRADWIVAAQDRSGTKPASFRPG